MKYELKKITGELITDTADINLKYVNLIISRHEKNAKCINLMYDGLDLMEMQYNSDMMNCTIRRYNDHSMSSIDVYFKREEALINLDCMSWLELMEISKIREYMDYTAYSDMCDMFKTRNKEKNIPFDYEHVMGFLESILNNKDTIFASKIEGLLLNLDKGYKSNQGNSLSAVLVLNAPSFSNNLGYEKVNLLKDLRYSIRQIYKLPLDVKDTQDLIYEAKGDDCWCPLDHDLIRIKSFKNGNVHIHLSDVVYEKINEILYIVNKNILDHDTSKVKRKTYKYKGDLFHDN